VTTDQKDAICEVLTGFGYALLFLAAVPITFAVVAAALSALPAFIHYMATFGLIPFLSWCLMVVTGFGCFWLKPYVRSR
jgi:hypothetical protein